MSNHAKEQQKSETATELASVERCTHANHIVSGMTTANPNSIVAPPVDLVRVARACRNLPGDRLSHDKPPVTGPLNTGGESLYFCYDFFPSNSRRRSLVRSCRMRRLAATWVAS